jgi:CS domain
VPDVPPSNIKLDLTPTSLTFTGHSETLKQTYHVELEFYAEIDKEESKINHTAKNIEMVLRKKELKEEYWPRLLKDAKKVHFLKTDFDKVRIKSDRIAIAADQFSGSMRMSKTRRLRMILAAWAVWEAWVSLFLSAKIDSFANK